MDFPVFLLPAPSPPAPTWGKAEVFENQDCASVFLKVPLTQYEKQVLCQKVIRSQTLTAFPGVRAGP